MSTDIFKSDAKIAGAWHLDEAVLSVEGADDLVAIGFQLQYGRQVTPYRPLNTKGTYLIGGRGSGSVSLTALVGPNAAIKNFLNQYSDICRAAENVMTIKPGGVEDCTGDGATPITFLAAGCVLTNLQVSVTSIGDLSVVTTGMNMLINGLEIK